MTGARNRNHQRGQAQRVLDRRTETRFGTITSFDPTTMTARVLIQPEGIETGWLELPTLVAGLGWGITFGPTQGMQVKVDFEGGDIDCGAISHFVYSDADPPPNDEGTYALPGEIWAVGQEGQRVRLLKGGHVKIDTPAEGNMIVDVGSPQEETGYHIETTGDCIDIQAGSIRLRNQGGRRHYIIGDIYHYGQYWGLLPTIAPFDLPPAPGRPDDPDGNPEP